MESGPDSRPECGHTDYMSQPFRCLTIAVLIAIGACSTAAQPARQMDPASVVATIGSTPVTLAEVDERALQQPASAFGGARLVQALYLARRAALEEMIADRLIDQEAKTRGVDRAALVEREITSVAAAPTDADIEFWYQTNPTRVQGARLDQVRDAIRDLLTKERLNAAKGTFVEKLKTKTLVSLRLEPPRVAIATEGHPFKGPKDAPIDLVEFSDFQCPFCQRANPTVAQVLQTYGDRIRFVYRHYPLENHPSARPAAEASACAHEQGRFWSYHDQLFANPTKLTDEDLKAHAAAVRLDAAKFDACFTSHKFSDAIERDIREANEAGVSGTPAFFINGRAVEGAQPFQVFQRLIDEELALKKK